MLTIHISRQTTVQGDFGLSTNLPTFAEFQCLRGRREVCSCTLWYAVDVCCAVHVADFFVFQAPRRSVQALTRELSSRRDHTWRGW